MNKYKFVEKPKSGNRFVIGDIHGCLKTFQKLLTSINFAKNDQLFLIGDYIDRGPESKNVLDFIIDLNNNPNVYPLLGNHEKTLLELNNEEFRFLEFHLAKNQELNLLDGKKINTKYLDFIESLPFFYELDHFFIVHAGFDFNKNNPFEEYSAMLEIRNMPYNSIIAKNKTIVIGHQPTNKDEIIYKVNNREKVIHLDNGIAYRKKHKVYDYTKMGNLVALNLDSFELFFEENIDIQRID
ncbi:metallophosphoesterase family protein [Bacteroidota bacterium]